MRSPLGLYVHLPFCASRCAYCTFVTSTEEALMPRTLAAVRREVESFARGGRRRLASLYLGGGTPSLVPPESLEPVLAAVRDSFELPAEAEFTLEANPDDVTPERLAGWRRLGVNRVSVGVQSFADDVLAMLGRRHSAAQAGSAVAALLEAGFAVSLDLILGLPRLDESVLEATLADVVGLRPHHVSVYLLEMDKPHELADSPRAIPTSSPTPTPRRGSTCAPAGRSSPPGTGTTRCRTSRSRRARLVTTPATGAGNRCWPSGSRRTPRAAAGGGRTSTT